MDVDRAADDLGLPRRIAGLWRPLPRWERVVYVLAGLLLSLYVLVYMLSQRAWTHSLGWGEWGTWWRLGDIGGLLLAVGFPFGVAACCLALRRWRPETWHDFRQYWSMRAVLIGSSVFLVGLNGWDSAIGLATPLDRIPPMLPQWLAVPAIVAAGLLIVGMALAAPEVIMRKSLARRRQP